MKFLKGSMLNYLLLAAISLTGCQVDYIAESMIFHPPKYPEGRWNEQPANCEDANFTNAKNETLHGWYYPADGTPKAIILYCHGNGENVSDNVSAADNLRNRLQSTLFVFDYAGYGKSKGEPSTKGILDDARAARAWLAKKCGVKETDIVVYGRSLGGAVAVDLAAKDGARGLIVESSFTSLGDMGRKLVPVLPLNWMFKENLASVKKIGNYRGHVFISHGKADKVVPFAQGERLFKAANEPKTFFLLPVGSDGHNSSRTAEHFDKLREFVDGLPAVKE